ncbi:pentapeptide repeat-containing protein [Streptomyces sp. SP18BB07]|uniref:pentapeptide repeat-containing protein n=1 Tax=Streptomyces sp. SP18BB07 TaxID=3002522 RepID=UPI002E7960D3|nr:pentapeptide repeat-containing protein [Streptomyces sp. SP18BB07]MEE1759742.1 pentapeptide repeat-containing protein [Streptomyces sp. SP18BB07]
MHIVVVLVLAVAAALTVLGLLWLMLGEPRVQVSGPLKPGDTYDAIKIALAVVAGVGGVVALVVAYRRQHLNEATDLREYGKALIERFGAAAEQLGADQPAVRMAGAYAMARLADEWPQERQMCIDVLCGYLRMPHAPDPPTDDQALASWQREREVRVTVLGLIAAHLRNGAPASWQGYDLDFTGAVLDEADFRGARFTGGDVLFVKTLFAGHGTDQIIFDEADFAEGAHVYFRLAEFRSGTVRFNRSETLPSQGAKSRSRALSSPMAPSTSPARSSPAPQSTLVNTISLPSTARHRQPASAVAPSTCPKWPISATPRDSACR